MRGVDIDGAALEIALQNRALNGQEHFVEFGFPGQFEDNTRAFDIVVANMTLGDAKQDFPHYVQIFSGAKVLILSGLLLEQKIEALTLFPPFFTMEQELVDGQWLGLMLFANH